MTPTPQGRYTAAERAVRARGGLAAHARGLHNAAIERAASVNEEFVRRVLGEHNLTSNPAPPRLTARHGDPGMWVRCSCDTCSVARAAYKHRDNQRRKAEFADDGTRPHGVFETYMAGCQCGDCRAAAAARSKSRNHATRPRATAHGEPWTKAEDDAVLDRSRRIVDIAADLGRTFAAVDNRRRLLLRRPEHGGGDSPEGACCEAP